MERGRGAVVADVTVSVDGYVAGPGASVDRPLGAGGDALAWYGDGADERAGAFPGTSDRVDPEALQASGARGGAVVMGRRTFDASVAAWGDEPPVHKPCFVVTNRPEATISRRGGTTFTFVDSPWRAVREARHAAAGRDVGVMGGAAIVRALLWAGVLDELHLHVVPVVLGGGTRLFAPPWGDAAGRDEADDGLVLPPPAGLDPLRLRTLSVRLGARAVHLAYGAEARIDRARAVVAASPDTVYRAFADPRSLERWLPPPGMTGTLQSFDFREGGSFRMRLAYAADGAGRGKTTDDADEVVVRLTRLEPARAIHQQVVFDSVDPSFVGVMRMTWTFVPVAAGTLVEVRAEDVPAGILPEDHAEGLHASLAGLARFLTSEDRPA